MRITIELQGMADADEMAIRLTGSREEDVLSLRSPGGAAGATDAGPAPLDDLTSDADTGASVDDDRSSATETTPDTGTARDAGAAQVPGLPPAGRAG